jgi:hypothetical protein
MQYYPPHQNIINITFWSLFLNIFFQTPLNSLIIRLHPILRPICGLEKVGVYQHDILFRNKAVALYV